jgi:hypothetical protein
MKVRPMSASKQKARAILLSGLVFGATASAGVAAVDAEQTAGSLGGSELTDPGGFLYAATNEASGNRIDPPA